MAGPTGLGPSQIQSAYKLAGLTSGGKTVAIVDAFDDPNAASDLATFRSTYGLPACTTANGCFKKVNENGATSPLPSGDYGWAEEESLDLDAVSSACPDCHILLVEAELGEHRRPRRRPRTRPPDRRRGGGLEQLGRQRGLVDPRPTDSHFNHPGVAITASSGDSRLRRRAGPAVIAVRDRRRRHHAEPRRATRAAGARPPGREPAADARRSSPSRPGRRDTGCAKRTVADVSADADPNSGLGVYDTYNSCGSSSFCDLLIEVGVAQGLDGWAQVGGTSLSSPLIASVYALAGNAASVTYGSYPYSHTASLFDVTSGSNGILLAVVPVHGRHRATTGRRVSARPNGTGGVLARLGGGGTCGPWLAVPADDRERPRPRVRARVGECRSVGRR